MARAVTDAKAGDGKARDWLVYYLVGSSLPKVLDVAADEELGRDAVTDRASEQRRSHRLDSFYDELDDSDADD